jgi:hypothetical protein
MLTRREFIDKLNAGIPIFMRPPEVKVTETSIILGTESEHGAVGVNNESRKPEIVSKSDLHFIKGKFLSNGGKVYLDGHLVETCTPECSNAASWLAYYEALKELCHLWFSSRLTLYANNSSWYCCELDYKYGRPSQTYGHHLNCSVRTDPILWSKLIPYFVASVVFAGAGRYSKGHFYLSQRAHFIEQLTAINPPFEHDVDENDVFRLCGRLRESHSNCLIGDNRLHYVLFDDTMCEFQSFARIGMTLLIIEMLEKNCLPKVDYDLSYAREDFKTFSQCHRNWRFRGMRFGPVGPVELLSVYLKQIRDLFMDRDDVTNAVIFAMEIILERLATDPKLLFGYIDWVTKKVLLEKYSEIAISEDDMYSQDLSYHELSPNGIYYYLKSEGYIRRIVSRRMIDYSMQSPPKDTRAKTRGEIVTLINRSPNVVLNQSSTWDEMVICHYDNKLLFREINRAYQQEIRLNLNDPRKTYPNELLFLKRQLGY